MKKLINTQYVDKTFWGLFIALIVVAILALFSASSTLVYEKQSAGFFLPLDEVFFAGALLVLPKDMHVSTLMNTIESNRCTVFHSVPTNDCDTNGRIRVARVFDYLYVSDAHSRQSVCGDGQRGSTMV